MGILDSILNSKDYDERIREGLSKAYDKTAPQPLDLDQKPIVFLSDLHKGSGDRADDFRRCEYAYRTCLEHYYRAGFRLFVLGDVEELWEEWPAKVTRKYEDTLRQEARFHAENRYERLWGNHDDLWNRPEEVAKHLHDVYPDLRVHEALKFNARLGGREVGILFLVHGHQGTADSDSRSKIPRLFVRHVWRNIQRLTNVSRNTPAKDWGLRLRHNRAMFDWSLAHPESVVMIAGHTHKPVFWESKDSSQEFELTRPEIGLPGTKDQPPAPPTDPFTVPCYFNTGCCAFSDGDVTAIEIEDGKIRLVRWLDDQGRPEPQLLTRGEDLVDVFDRVANKPRP